MFVILPFCTGSQLIVLYGHHNSNILPLRQHIAAALHIFHAVLQIYNLLHVHVDTINAHYFKCRANVHLKNIKDLFLIAAE